MPGPPPDLALAERLFNHLADRTRLGRGIVRDTYGAGEQAAHDLLRAAALRLGLGVSIDAIGNLFMTLPGRDPAAASVIVGSHLDSVPQGGNYDGAAGVVAGLAVLAGWRSAGRVPGRDIGVMAVRGEESAWFDVSYIGSAGALGRLDPADLDVKRHDTGQTLSDAMTARGFDPAAVRARRVLLDPKRLRAYLEVHIEQAPLLLGEDLPVATVTGIRGCLRFREARCIGEYTHSGAVPRAYRRDAVAATVALLHRLEQDWLVHEAAGDDLVLTSGEFSTDPALHGPSKVAGETRFVIDIRSLDEATMRAMAAAAQRHAAAIEAEYRVTFDLGAPTFSVAALMDPELRRAFRRETERLGIRPFEMASGAGHDAAVFAAAGVPTGMLFIRNRNGSHNPDEAMEMGDFGVAAQVLSGVLARLAA